MKRFFSIVNFVVLSLILATSGARAEPPIIDTDKSMHNLDPYYWVYSASQYEWQGVNPNLWPAEGHTISIGFSLNEYVGGLPLTFSVEGLADSVTGDVVLVDGTYRGAFEVSEASVAGEVFKPGEKDSEGSALLPKVLTLTISDLSGAVAERQINISRWACDRCHIAQAEAMEVYSWSAPAGGPLGPHNWPHVLGRNGGRPGFTYDHLTDDSLTHTPTVGAWVKGVWVENPLNRQPYHQKTNTKIAGRESCSPCHHGSGRVRHAWSGVEGEFFLLSMERSMTVKCVFCHSNDAGYVPNPDGDRPMWENWKMRAWN